MTKDQAIAFYKSGAWKAMSDEERARFQISERCLCMPFDVFHKAVEKTLGRPVYTHEFGLNYEGIKAELLDGADPPSLEDILNLIPEEKRVVVLVPQK